ncbi:sphingosine-1-phosphate phosphatase 1-like isoform X1 [Hippocampus zosterae]|uniref:sphingosine-1-phosphate phosphatase 1-like isoform X1 n=1 Tax=Hippocampus zosterae TaxID=109293 RepID=UPI00223D4B85|nr:sphingosine-1-phosphate phosphatase 1-like isoform X1 [Hippocampus zosterae]
MGSRGRLAELFRFLRDPHLVARFQRLCGVRGGFSGASRRPLRRNSLTDDAGQEFVAENRFLYYLFTLGAELGNEPFYLSFFPFLLWNVDALVSRRLIMVWVCVMYLGQCTKDVLRWSRPASPPVVKVEMFYDCEYGMPSTHAMSGTAIPFALFFLTRGRWQYSLSLGLALAVCWCLLVCVSRIYMGMHSLLDVMAGVLYSALILLFLLPALDAVDEFVLTGAYAPAAAAALPAGLGLLSFALDGWSTSRADTAQILGSGAGVALGSRVNRLLGLLPDPPPERLPLAPPPLAAAGPAAAAAALRWGAGVLVLVATRALMKALVAPALRRVWAVPEREVRRARRGARLELPYRYVVYAAVGFNVLFLAPLLFRFLRLS